MSVPRIPRIDRELPNNLHRVRGNSVAGHSKCLFPPEQGPLVNAKVLGDRFLRETISKVARDGISALMVAARGSGMSLARTVDHAALSTLEHLLAPGQSTQENARHSHSA
jgi:hypothetical protein